MSTMSERVIFVMMCVLMAGCAERGEQEQVLARTPTAAVKRHVQAIVDGNRDLYMNVTCAEDEDFLALTYDVQSANVMMQRLLERRYGEGAVDRFNELVPKDDSLNLKTFPLTIRSGTFSNIQVKEVQERTVCYISEIDALYVIHKEDDVYRVNVQAGVDPQVLKDKYLKPGLAKLRRGIDFVEKNTSAELNDVVRACCE